MKYNRRAALFFVILFPILFGFVFNLTPRTSQTDQLWQQVQTAQKSQNYLNMVEAYQSLHQIMPWRTTEAVFLARAFFQLNNWQAVITAYERVSDSVDLTREDLYQLAEAHWELDNLELTRSAWDQVRMMSDNSSEDFQHLVNVQHQHQDWYAAYQTLLTWQEKLPQDSALFYDLGLSQLIYDPERAEQSLIRSLEKQPQRFDKIRIFQSALPAILEEENSVMRLMFAGNLLSQQNEWDYAAAAYGLVLRTVPDYAEAWALYSNALTYLGEDGNAALRKAQSLDKNSTLVQAMSAYDLRRKEQFEDSLTIWKTLTSREPENAVWFYEQGVTYALAGDLEEALRAYQAAAVINENDSFFWKELAQFCLDYSIGLDSIGIDAARKALILNPDDSGINDLMGWIFFYLDDFVSAERFVLKAQSQAPYSAIVHLHLGQIYLKQNKIKSAEENLVKSIQLAQNPVIKKQAEQLLSDFISN